jgi:outer membrane PBP1 activator LpoA protein
MQPFSYLQQGQNHSDNALAGWLQLAELHRRYQLNHGAHQLAYNDWQQRWRTHPAAKVPPSAIINHHKSASAPQQIGLMKPCLKYVSMTVALNLWRKLTTMP